MRCDVIDETPPFPSIARKNGLLKRTLNSDWRSYHRWKLEPKKSRAGRWQPIPPPPASSGSASNKSRGPADDVGLRTHKQGKLVSKSLAHLLRAQGSSKTVGNTRRVPRTCGARFMQNTMPGLPCLCSIHEPKYGFIVCDIGLPRNPVSLACFFSRGHTHTHTREGWGTRGFPNPTR